MIYLLALLILRNMFKVCQNSLTKVFVHDCRNRRLKQLLASTLEHGHLEI